MIYKIDLETRRKLYGNISYPVESEHIEMKDNIQAEDEKENFLKFSPFILCISEKNKTLLYNKITLNKLWGYQQLAELYNLTQKNGAISRDEVLRFKNNCFSQDDLNILIRNEFLVPPDYNTDLALKNIHGLDDFQEPHIHILNVLLTYKCNLQCLYCINNLIVKERRFDGKFPLNFMSLGTFKKGMELFSQTLSDKYEPKEITFLGGEPLLAWNVLKEALEYIRLQKENGRLGKDLKIILITNGLLLDDDKIKKLKKYNVNVSFSLDGLESQHNAYRLTPKKESVYKEVIRSYKICRETLENVSISCTIGPHNSSQLKEIVEYFALELGASAICFNLMKGCTLKNGIKYNHDKAINNMIESFKLLRGLGIYEHRIMRQLSAFVEEVPRLHDCSSFGRQIVIDPGGLIGACPYSLQVKQNLYGNINDYNLKNTILDSPESRKKIKRSPFFMEKCKDCSAIGICGGGCIHEVLAHDGKFDNTDPLFCRYAKLLLDWMLKDLLINL